MTTKDRTGDRLVASIRRTRAGAEKSTDESVAAKDSPKPAPARRTRSSAGKGAARKADAARDSYQSGGRVWPD